MDNEQLYTEWKQRRRQVPVPAGFTDRVMAELRRNSIPRRSSEPHRVKAFVLQWALSLGLALLGLIRLSFVTYNLLVP